MLIKLYREVNPIKNGWCARSPVLKLAAHGYSQEVADKNLERTVRLFLAPFQREGTLQEELHAVGLELVEDGNVREIAVVFDHNGDQLLDHAA
jgi:hypothetical protein